MDCECTLSHLQSPLFLVTSYTYNLFSFSYTSHSSFRGVSSPYIAFYQLDGPYLGYSLLNNHTLHYFTCPDYFCLSVSPYLQPFQVSVNHTIHYAFTQLFSKSIYHSLSTLNSQSIRPISRCHTTNRFINHSVFQIALVCVIFLPLLVTFCVCYFSLIHFLRHKPIVGTAETRQRARKRKVRHYTNTHNSIGK